MEASLVGLSNSFPVQCKRRPSGSFWSKRLQNSITSRITIQEVNNLASSNPELVEELLREAELVVKDAPPAVRGDRTQVNSEFRRPFYVHACSVPKIL